MIRMSLDDATLAFERPPGGQVEVAVHALDRMSELGRLNYLRTA